MRTIFGGAGVRGAIFGAAVLWAFACTSSDGGGGDDDSNDCERGTEGCACVDGACLTGLTCMSEVCVSGTSGTGGTQGGGAGAATGGSPQGGSGASPSGGTGSGMGGGATGGTSGAGGAATGGASGSGGAGAMGAVSGSGSGNGGAAGAGGAGGSAGMCTADTQTDPENCGSCGRVCMVYEVLGQCSTCCTAGMCGDSFGDCIRAADGFETCAEYCASIGEECVQQGCGMNTARAWSTPNQCEQFAAPAGAYNDPCDTPINFASDTIRCCCTDRAP